MRLMLHADKESGTKPQESVATRELLALIAAKSAISAVKETRSKTMSSITHARHWLKQAIFTNETGIFAVKGQICHHLGNVAVMVRNHGQLPQPFWLGVVCGGGSCSAARCAART